LFRGINPQKEVFMNLRIRRSFAAVVLGTLLLGGCGWPDPSQYSYTLDQADRSSEEVLKGLNGGGSLSVAVMVDGKVLWAKGYGLANAKTSQPVSTETMYGIGSSSKMFVAAAVMKLVEAGKLDLDKPVTTYLPEFRMASPEYTQITVRMLIDHSSGFPGTLNYAAQTTGPLPAAAYVDRLLESLKSTHLKHTPGYMSVYCNDGFTLTEKVVEAVSGKTYPQFVQDEILKPLQMTHSRYPLEFFPDASFAHEYSDGNISPQEFVNTPGSGGLYSTPTDLCHFLAMLASEGRYEGRQFLSRSSVAAMGTDQIGGTFRVVESPSLRYGLGWDMVTHPGLRAVGQTAWMKGGDTSSYGSCIMVIPGERLAAAVTGVGGVGSEKGEILCERILMAALVDRGKLAAIPSPLAQTPLTEAAASQDFLNTLTGFYSSNAGLLRISEENGALAIAKRNFDTWQVEESGLKYRVNGWFSADSNPGKEYAFTAADGRWYLVGKVPGGNGHYRTASPSAQRITAGKELSAAWKNRLGRTWLMANDLPLSISWAVGADPRLRMIEVDEVKGLLWVCAQAAGQSDLGMIDPASSDQWARPSTLIPFVNGRDQNELQVVQTGSEEWMRYSGLLFRPLETIGTLAAGQTKTLVIGSEGYTEWFRLTPGAAACTITVTASSETRWSLYNPQYQQLAQGWGNATSIQPVWGAGDLLLAVTGTAGGQVTVGRTP
jgi:CubicO group peptidase (beta-lactamase class C family)